jgi:hypothetical protein
MSEWRARSRADSHPRRTLVSYDVFQKQITDQTAEKTHSLALLTPIAHFVVSLHLDGRIHSQGSMQKVMEDDKTLSNVYSEQTKTVEMLDDKEPTEVDGTNVASEDGKLVAAEEVSEGHVGWSAGK